MNTNFLKTILIALLPICAVSCIDNIPQEEVLPRDAVSFEYFIDQEKEPKYYLDFYVDTDITFLNTSPESTSGTPTWDFGDGSDRVTGDEVIHYYKQAGTYKVKLTVGEFSKEQVVMIAPIKPIITFTIQDEYCEVKKSLVQCEVELPNPKKKKAVFSWAFPEGTVLENSSNYPKFETTYYKDATDSIITFPEPIMFSHVGSQTVKLSVTLVDTMGNKEELELATKGVPVAYSEPVPTFYYAEVNGTIKAHKLVKNVPNGMNIYSYDLGVASGMHPLNILFSQKDTLLYVLDAGKQFYYVNDVNGVLGDGKISAVAADGSKVQTMLTNAGLAAFDDPFYGYIDGSDLYYANRNTGIFKIPLKERDKLSTDFSYWVQHNTLGYYNNGISYGAIGGMFGKIDGVWHWTKFYNGNGIFRFVDADIQKKAVDGTDKSIVPKSGILLDGMWPKSFAYIPKTKNMCLHIMDVGFNGVYLTSYANFVAAGTSKNALSTYAVTCDGKMFESNATGNLPAKEGTGTESIGICQMVYDEHNDRVYFAYRNNAEGGAEKFPKSGIYYIDNASQITSKGEAVCLIPGVEAYGLSVNNYLTKLFY